MIIINTTYQVKSSVEAHFLLWLRKEYIPSVVASGELIDPRMTRILDEQEEGVGYSLQFRVESTAVLHRWFLKSGNALSQESAKRFGEKVMAFTTLLEEIPVL